MITVYRVFQLILGLILSGFVLYLLLYYAGGYAQVGESMARQKVLEVLLQDSEGVLFSGIPTTFEHTSRYDFTPCYPAGTGTPVLTCNTDEETLKTRQLTFPLFTRLGDEEDAFLARGTYDLGWTSIDYVTATGTTEIIFTPFVDPSDDASWSLIQGIVNALPDTTGQEPKLTFGFCDGGDVVASSGGERWEKPKLLNILKGEKDMLALCLAPLSPRQILVTISPECSNDYAGICILPPAQGSGTAFIHNVPGSFAYKDPYDLVALILGGERKTIMGTAMGKEAWDFKNKLFLSHIRLAAEVMESRCDFVVSSIPDDLSDCVPLYTAFQALMGEVKEKAGGDYHDLDAMGELSQDLNEARDAWEELKDRGCEVDA
jgi:hypothetical protein